MVSALLGYVILVLAPLKFTHLFSDFAEVLTYGMVKNPYDGSGGVDPYGAAGGITSIYPPISYLIFLPFLIFCRQDIQDLLDGKIDLSGIASRPMFVVAYVIYFVITLALILWVLAKMTKLTGKNLFYLLGSIIFSGPIFYLFIRGNIILTAGLLTLVFFWLYQSEKRWQRELAYLCLALAIAIKIYPVIIALVLLKERRWVDLVKTGFYAMLFVFVPFVFVAGGLIDNIKCILNSYHNMVDRGVAFSLVSLVGVANVLAH